MESDSLATDFSLRVVYAIGFHAKILTANEHEKHDERCREAQRRWLEPSDFGTCEVSAVWELPGDGCGVKHTDKTLRPGGLEVQSFGGNELGNPVEPRVRGRFSDVLRALTQGLSPFHEK